jgi:hypothetical protein
LVVIHPQPGTAAFGIGDNGLNVSVHWENLTENWRWTFSNSVWDSLLYSVSFLSNLIKRESGAGGEAKDRARGIGRGEGIRRDD